MNPDIVKSLAEFIDTSYTPYHAVDAAKSYLAAHGTILLDEREPWKLEPGVRYMVLKGGSLIAFMPGVRKPGEAGVAIACAHTDSPGLKVRLGSEHSSKGLRRVGVEIYGGPILSGWFDTPLALSGRIAYEKDHEIVTALYDSVHPVGLVPRLAIHLDRDANKGTEHNPHHHLPVLLGLGDFEPSRNLAKLVAESLGIDPELILGADLFFRDSAKAVLIGGQQAGGMAAYSGINPEGLLNAPRLDDLAGCHAILEAFSQAQVASFTQVACLLEAEEIGSKTAQGADSSFLRDILSRISLAAKAPAEDFYRMISRSFCVSIDAAQAWNPSYAEKYDERFSPLLGGGPAVKSNANRRYASDASTEAAFRALCKRAGVKSQTYMSRADMQPGTTIGPITASRLGIRTVDVGHPLLAMHSIRETIHGADHAAMAKALEVFYSTSPDIVRD